MLSSYTAGSVVARPSPEESVTGSRGALAVAVRCLPSSNRREAPAVMGNIVRA